MAPLNTNGLSEPSVPPVTVKSPEEPSQEKLLPVLSLTVTVKVAVSPALREATLNDTDTEGVSVSTMYELLLLTAEDAGVDVLLAASVSTAPFKLKALMAMAMPSASFWPETMVVVNTKVLVPAPDT